MRPKSLARSAVVCLVALLATTGAHAQKPPARIALFIADATMPPGTCRLNDVRQAFVDLRFETERVSGAAIQPALKRFGQASRTAEAAVLYVCNPRNRRALSPYLNASELNFLFLLETAPAGHGEPIAEPVDATRENLKVVHVRVATPENDEVFARTFIRKLKRPYSEPADIISRTVVSSYYESRGQLLIDARGKITSKYILTKPPTDQILDAWSRVARSTDPVALKAFIKNFPDTLFAELAKSRLAKLP